MQAPLKTEMVVELERLVQKPSWKDLLIKMVYDERLDPWNIDLVLLADLLIKKIKEDKEMLKYANIILAAAILLKIKSEILRFEEEVVVAEEENREIPVIENLDIVERLPPQRQVTLKELLDEVEKVIKIAERKEKRVEERKIEVFEIKIDAIDIEKQMQEVIRFVSTSPIEFYELIRKMGKTTKKDKVAVFLALLHLFQKSIVELKQEQTFGDLYVMKNEKNN